MAWLSPQARERGQSCPRLTPRGANWKTSPDVAPEREIEDVIACLGHAEFVGTDSRSRSRVARRGSSTPARIW